MFPLAHKNYNYMKLVLNNFFIFLFFVCNPAYGESSYKEFTIKVSGIKIGKLIWEMKINDESYSNDLKLKSEGFLSAIYKFEGEYFSEGRIVNKKLKPRNYKHVWKTKKLEKIMRLNFRNDMLFSLNQKPNEKEKLRINVFNIKHTKDPLSSFLEIIMGETNSLVVDGRRLYTMNAEFNEKNNETVIEISNYYNLWADHKRRKFEKITFEKKDDNLLPQNINIYFDGRIFKLEKN